MHVALRFASSAAVHTLREGTITCTEEQTQVPGLCGAHVTSLEAWHDTMQLLHVVMLGGIQRNYNAKSARIDTARQVARYDAAADDDLLHPL